MINLLADERKDQLRAARVNVILSRYIAIIVMAVVFVLAVLYFSYTVLQNTKTNADSIVQSNDVKATVYSGAQSQLDSLSSKLTQAKSVLNQDVSYSHILTNLGQLMPAGTILDSLDLNASSFSGAPVEIKAYAKTSEEAAALPGHLQSSPMFSLVTLKSTDSANGTDGYPVSVTLSVVFNKAGIK